MVYLFNNKYTFFINIGMVVLSMRVDKIIDISAPR